MSFNVIKNTVLFLIIIGFVLVVISCGNKSKQQAVSQHEMFRQPQPDLTDSTEIIVGANQTEIYLPLLKGKHVGVVANPSSVIFKNNGKYTHLIDSLLTLHVNITQVFSPEHGFRGKADAGEVVKDGLDTKTGLPIISLYGDNKKPLLVRFEGAEAVKRDVKKGGSKIDVMVFDLQDVGVRFYTYISTLHYIMESCAEAKIPLIVLDRPNPNGNYVDGPTLETKHKSFLGMHPIPLVHGMTIGEYAKMINGEKWLASDIQCDITVIPIKYYSHDTPYSLPIRPSPNLPNDLSIKLYPSLGLFEGTNVNAGRGTEFQFQRYGAPFLDKNVLSFTYTPIENFGAKHPKHKGKICYGEDLRNEIFNSSMTLKWIIKAYQNSIDKTLFFNTNNFTKHAGTAKLQQQIEAGLTELEIKATWQSDLEKFKKIRKKYLIYN